MPETLSKLLEEYPLQRDINYGTAGFRGDCSYLERPVIVAAAIAALRASDQSLATGLCITASHNLEPDNGVKIVQPDGSMIESKYENLAVNLLRGDADVLEMFENMKPTTVILARDTRSSSPKFAQLAIRTFLCLNTAVLDLGRATTPMLHWAVIHFNNNIANYSSEEIKEAYFSHFENALRLYISESDIHPSLPLTTLICDAAGGVGSVFIEKFNPAFLALGCNLRVRNRSMDPTVVLNKNCGSEYVQKNMLQPDNVGVKHGDPPNSSGFSMDGDADRIVFFCTPSHEENKIAIIDGDRIAVILWKVIFKLLCEVPKPRGFISLAYINTAYANGASSLYVKTLMKMAGQMAATQGLSFHCVTTKTGVKYLHKEAAKYDIAIYYESNGHGTVIYKKTKLEDWCGDKEVRNISLFSDFQISASRKLFSFLDILNPATGDAMTNALAFEAAKLWVKSVNLSEYFQDTGY